MAGRRVEAPPPREHEWVADGDRLREIVARVKAEPAYAIDTEFHGERTYRPQLALVQLGWSDGIALIDSLAVDLSSMRELLEGPGTAVLHAATQDLELLETACGARPRVLFDTQLAAGFLGLSTPSLDHLATTLLRLRLPKGDRLTDWAKRPLTPAQCAYAASDVAHLLEMHRRIEGQLEAQGRLEWARHECERLRTKPREERPFEAAWWRLKGSRRLKGPSRGVAQCVAAWRERTAARVNRPARFLFPDLGILAIAEQLPRDADELGRLRGVDPRVLKNGVAADILRAIEQGIALPSEDVVLPPEPEGESSPKPVVQLVSAWVAQLAEDLRIDSTLLATRADLQALLRGDADARAATGWREEIVARPLRRLLAGEAGLVVEDGDHLALREPSELVRS